MDGESRQKTATPNEFWGTDMTNVMIPGEGWVYVPVVIDWGSKKRLSLHASRTSKASDWQTALDEAVNTQFSQGIREIPVEKRPILVSGHGCRPTSESYKSYCQTLGRTLKEDLVYPREFTDYSDFTTELSRRQKSYNEEFPHSSLGWFTPYEYERWFLLSQAA